jgi:hypothetical protein
VGRSRQRQSKWAGSTRRCTRTALVTAPFLFGTIINAAFLKAGGSPADPDQDTVIRAVEDAKRVLNIFHPGQRHAVRTVGGVAQGKHGG